MIYNKLLSENIERFHLWLLILTICSIEIFSFSSKMQHVSPGSRPNFGVNRNKHKVHISRSILYYHDNRILMDNEHTGLQEKLHDLVKNGPNTDQKKNHHKDLIKEIQTLNDLNEIITNEKDKVIIVRFYAHWCKVRIINGLTKYLLLTLKFSSWIQECMVTTKYFNKLAREENSIIFINVPFKKENENMFKSLGVIRCVFVCVCAYYINKILVCPTDIFTCQMLV